MTFAAVLLWSAAVLAAIVLLCAAVIWFERKFPGKAYDERQNLYRGNAYSAAFWVGAAYFFAYICWLLPDSFEPPVELDPFLVVYIGLIIQAMVFHTYCLLTKSALPLSGKPIFSMISYGMLGTQSLLNYYFRLNNPYVGDSMQVVSLVNGFSFYALILMHLISLLWKEKE